MKKLGLILAGSAIVLGTLTGCTYTAGDSCSSPGMAGKDDKGHDLMCSQDKKGNWVWQKI